MTRATDWLRATIFLTIFIAALARFAALESSPPGFWTDEAATATQIMCVRDTGHDMYLERWPLFAPHLDDGWVTVAELYGGAAWTWAFGDSIYALRAFSAFVTSCTLAGLGLLLTRLGLGARMATWAVLLGSISPWAFQFSRIAWDPPLAPCFLVWALVFFFWSTRAVASLSAGLLFALAMYSYPPMRVQAPLIAPALIWLRAGMPGFQRRQIGIVAASAVVFSSPLLYFTWTGALLARFHEVSIFSRQYLEPLGGFSVTRVTGIFFGNLVAHFSWDYLAVSGDANLRHSTQLFGEWSWIDLALCMAGTFMLARRTLFIGASAASLRMRLLAFCAFAYVAGIVPSAMTNEGVPHALRSIGAWPFLAIALAIVAERLSEKWQRFPEMLGTASLAFFGYFLLQFFTVYPETAQQAFRSDVVAAASEARRTDDWRSFAMKATQYPGPSRYYFFMHYGSRPCKGVKHP